METNKPLREQLQEDLLENTPWDALRLHAEKDAVLLVQNLDLIDVGEAFAQDNTANVSAWLQAGHIRRPTSAEIKAFALEQQEFHALIVQPWVLIKI